MVVTNNSRWSKVWIGVFSFLLPLSSFLVISCGNKPSEEECARAEQLIEAAHKAKDYKQLMQLADNFEAKGTLTPAKAYYWRGYASDRTNRRRTAASSYNTARKAAAEADLAIYA